MTNEQISLAESLPVCLLDTELLRTMPRSSLVPSELKTASMRRSHAAERRPVPSDHVRPILSSVSGRLEGEKSRYPRSHATNRYDRVYYHAEFSSAPGAIFPPPRKTGPRGTDLDSTCLFLPRQFRRYNESQGVHGCGQINRVAHARGRLAKLVRRFTIMRVYV